MKSAKCLQCSSKINPRPRKIKIKSGYKIYLEKNKSKFCSKDCYHNHAKGKPLTGYNLKRSRIDVLKAIEARKSNPQIRKKWIAKMKEVTLGSLNPNWVKDRSSLANQDERGSYTYAKWRRSVHLRDNFKCRMKDKNCVGKIEVHHILSWKNHPEIRYKYNNGITLCHAHHPRVISEEKRLIPKFQELVSVSNKQF